jgi:hypothetical protein
VNNVTARVNKTRKQKKTSGRKGKQFQHKLSMAHGPCNTVCQEKANENYNRGRTEQDTVHIGRPNRAVSDAPGLISLQVTNGLNIYFTLHMKCGKALSK